MRVEKLIKLLLMWCIFASFTFRLFNNLIAQIGIHTLTIKGQGQELWKERRRVTKKLAQKRPLAI